MRRFENRRGGRHSRARTTSGRACCSRAAATIVARLTGPGSNRSRTTSATSSRVAESSRWLRVKALLSTNTYVTGEYRARSARLPSRKRRIEAPRPVLL